MTQSETHQSAFSQLAGQANADLETQEVLETNCIVDAKMDNIVPFISKNSMSCLADEKTASQAQHLVVGDHIADTANLSKMELRGRYPREAASHKNMLNRRQSKGAKVHSAFLEFSSFLRQIGPMPAKGATLDRIDNTDPEYAPGKVRWADRRTQNSNKSDTLIFHSTATGETFTAFQLAKRQAVSTDTIRKRRARGWTDDEIVAGKRAPLSSPVKASAAPVGNLLSQFPEGLYSTQQLAALNRPESMLAHAADIDFHRDARSQQAYRETEGEEYFPALYDELVEILCEGGNDPYGMKLPGSRERVDSHNARLWHRTFKRHVVFANLTPAQKQFVAKIDPEYVAKQQSE